MIKIYGPKLGSAFRCHVLMLEMGIEYEEIKVDFEKGDQFKPEYLRLNPNGKIPCIVDGDFVLWESMAINNYLATKYKTDLLGDSPEEKALVDQWSYWSMLEMQHNLYTIAFQKFRATEDQKDEKAVEKAMEELPKVFKILGSRCRVHIFPIMFHPGFSFLFSGHIVFCPCGIRLVWAWEFCQRIFYPCFSFCPESFFVFVCP